MDFSADIATKSIRIADLKTEATSLLAGERVFLTGTIYTARDAAHKRLVLAIQNNDELPFDIKNAVIYYAGPTAAKDGMAVGSCGPTTAGRMDPYTPLLLDMGLIGMIGKGERNNAVNDAIVRNKAVYFCSIGGSGALASSRIKSSRVIAYDDLGCESIKEFYIEDFPVVVAVDSMGNDIFVNGRKKYQK